jgi:hypothetical protein
VLSDSDEIPGEIDKCCVEGALERLSGKLLAAASQLSSADVQTQQIPETLEKLQEYNAELQKYQRMQLEAPIAVLQTKLADRQILGAYAHSEQDCSDEKSGEEDNAQQRAGRAAAGHSNKRQRLDLLERCRQEQRSQRRCMGVDAPCHLASWLQSNWD